MSIYAIVGLLYIVIGLLCVGFCYRYWINDLNERREGYSDLEKALALTLSALLLLLAWPFFLTLSHIERDIKNARNRL